MSRDGSFHEEGAGNKDVKPEGSQMPGDKEIVSTERIDGQGSESDVVEVYKPPTRPPNAEEDLKPVQTNERCPRLAGTLAQGITAIPGASVVYSLS